MPIPSAEGAVIMDRFDRVNRKRESMNRASELFTLALFGPPLLPHTKIYFYSRTVSWGHKRQSLRRMTGVKYMTPNVNEIENREL